MCKLVFKVSRNEKNDPAFLDGNILGKKTGFPSLHFINNINRFTNESSMSLVFQKCRVTHWKVNANYHNDPKFSDR